MPRKSSCWVLKTCISVVGKRFIFFHTALGSKRFLIKYHVIALSLVGMNCHTPTEARARSDIPCRVALLRQHDGPQPLGDIGGHERRDGCMQVDPGPVAFFLRLAIDQQHVRHIQRQRDDQLAVFDFERHAVASFDAADR